MQFHEFKENFQKKPVTEYPNEVPQNPMVSICVQTYNQAQFIDECLKGLLSQETNFIYEILLGEDSSTDGTREICLQYAENHPDKIKLFLHERENNIKVDSNPTGLFNSLYNLYIARGKYIAYCDGDDYWTDPAKLQKQVNFLEENSKFVFTYHNAVLVDKEGAEITDIKLLDMIKRDFSGSELKKALVQPIISTWCFRNCIEDIPIEMTRTINADNFWISLLGNYGDGKYLEDVKPSYYRIHGEGIWSLIAKDRQFRSKRNTYRNLSAYYSRRGEHELSNFFRKRALNYWKMLIVFYLKRKKWKEVGKNLFPFLKYQVR